MGGVCWEASSTDTGAPLIEDVVDESSSEEVETVDPPVTGRGRVLRRASSGEPVRSRQGCAGAGGPGGVRAPDEGRGSEEGGEGHDGEEESDRLFFVQASSDSTRFPSSSGCRHGGRLRPWVSQPEEEEEGSGRGGRG